MIQPRLGLADLSGYIGILENPPLLVHHSIDNTDDKKLR